MSSHLGGEPADKLERGLVLALRVGVPLTLVGVTLWRIFAIDPTDRFFDDFFYYLVPARNWDAGHGSTFFPSESTNGYYPLWFLWLAFLYRIAGVGVFFGLVDVSITALLIGFFFTFERLLQRITGRPLAAAVGAAIASIAIAPRAMWGLEMALTAFAAAALLNYLARKPLAQQSTRDAAVAGLLASLLVLSRLDAVMLAPGLLVAVLPTWRWKRLAAVLLGGAPLYLYLAFNLVVFHHIFTTSMTAKSLAFYLPPNWYFLESEHPFPGAVVVGMALVAVVSVILLRRSDNADGRRLAIALLAAPFLQLLALAFMSGWGLYQWYFYFEFMALGLAAALMVARFAGSSSRQRLCAMAAALAVVIAAYPLSFAGGTRPNRDIARLARSVKEFSVTHPGVYAMGDAAGTAAWLIDQPMVHLEGLMMSQAFLDRIRHRQPLQEVFRDYHVDYYIAVRPSGVDGNGCLVFAEPSPAQASSRAPQLTTTLCQEPVAVIDMGPGYRVRIYRV